MRYRAFVFGLFLLAGIAPFAQAAQNADQITTTGPLPGLTLVNDANAAYSSLATLFSGSSAPTQSLCNVNTSCALSGYPWHDTSTNQIKVRDQADSAWISLFQLDETSKVATASVPLLATGSAQTIGVANHYGEFVFTAAQTATLNATTTFPAYASFSIFAEGGNVTVAINGSDKINGGSSGVGFTIPTGYVSNFVTDGAGNWWVTTEHGAVIASAIASASTTDLGSLGAAAITVSGTTTITSFGSSAQAGQEFFVTFSGALQLTYNGTSMILNAGGANYTTAAGDRAIVKALGSGNFEVTIEPVGGNVAAARTGQILSGGARYQSYSIGTVSGGTTTPDAGNGPSQWLVNEGAFTLAAPSFTQGSYDSHFIDLNVINGPSAGTITLSGFDVGSDTGDSFSTAAVENATVTITIASPAVVTYTGHGLPANWPIYFTNSGGALPTGITANTVYYLTAVTTNTFEIAATPGGAAINTSGSQSGTQTCYAASQFIFAIHEVHGQPTYRIESMH